MTSFSTEPYIRFTPRNTTPKVDISQYVPHNFEMNPETDAILFSGREIEVGMVILIQDAIGRGRPEHINSTDHAYADHEKWRCDRYNRWGKVLRVETSEGGEYSITKILVEFPNGVQDVWQYNVSYSWFVKKDSIPLPRGYVEKPPRLVEDMPLQDWERDLLYPEQ